MLDLQQAQDHFDQMRRQKNVAAKRWNFKRDLLEQYQANGMSQEAVNHRFQRLNEAYHAYQEKKNLFLQAEAALLALTQQNTVAVQQLINTGTSASIYTDTTTALTTAPAALAATPTAIAPVAAPLAAPVVAAPVAPVAAVESVLGARTFYERDDEEDYYDDYVWRNGDFVLIRRPRNFGGMAYFP